MAIEITDEMGMIRFCLIHLNRGSDEIDGPFRHTMEHVEPKLRKSSNDLEIEISTQEAVAITLIDIRKSMHQILQKLHQICPDKHA